MKDYISIIGGGLAGCEAAYQIAKRGIKVKLYEMKPIKFSPAHSNQNLAEIVCSNSLKSNLLTNACGLLKEELRRLDSLLIKIADETSVPAGQALAVDREIFAKRVNEELEKNPLVEITIRSLFLYNSRTISFKSVLIKGSPPVILVKYISGNFFMVSIEISSSGIEGALYLLHIEQRALQRYVTITVPFNFFDIYHYSLKF